MECLKQYLGRRLKVIISTTIINYLRLVRISNIFTIVPNILVGYFFFTPTNNLDYLDLIQLISISGFLYIGGMASNDYFDLKIDKKERPWRPLPSDKISQKNALLIILLSFSYSLTFSFIMGPNTFILILVMISLILLYNKFLKNTIFGAINMGVIRSLNIILGASEAILISEKQLYDVQFLIPLFAEFFYISAITILSKNETREYSLNYSNILPFAIIYLLIFFIAMFIMFDFLNLLSLFPLLIFLSSIFYSHIILLKRIITVQKSISYLIMMIVLLDSIFLTNILGVYYGIALSILLIIPMIFLSRRIYMT